MAALVYGLYTLAHTALLLWLLVRPRRTLATVLLALVLLALVYDNLILTLGRWVAAGPTLEQLSYPRFLLHALITPLLVPASLDQAARAGIPWAARRSALIVTLAITLGLIVMGLLLDYRDLVLEPQTSLGIVRYRPGEAAPPLPAITVICILLAIGISLWRRTGWRWMALAALAMLILSGVQIPVYGLLIGSFGEVLLMAGMVATERKLAGG